jgi:hypothetical protein
LNTIYAIFLPTNSQTAGGNSAQISVLPTTRGTTR